LTGRAREPTLPITENMVRLRVFVSDVNPMDVIVFGMEHAP
jgi:hypothetical protein